MEIPPHVEIHNHLTSIWWIEDDGILCSISKKDAPDISREQSLEQIADLNRITGGKKMCMLLEITHGKPSKREDREFLSQELAKVIKALALISQSALGKMVANLFFNLISMPPVPVQRNSPNPPVRRNSQNAPVFRVPRRTDVNHR